MNVPVLSPVPAGPTVACAGPAARFVIARTLRRLRHDAHLTQSQLARAIGVSPATVHRYEMWQDIRNYTRDTVLALAAVCGASPADQRCLAELVEGQNDGWWSQAELPAHQRPLLSFEAAARHVRLYSGGVVPELLQTRRYALALRGDPGPGRPCAPCDDADSARRRRLTVLSRRSFRLVVVLDEGVLRRVVGGREVMVEQCDRLMALAYTGNVELRILPFGAGVQPTATCGPFEIVTWEDAFDAPRSQAVVYQQHLRGGTYLDEWDDIDAYERAFTELRAHATDHATTTRTLASARQHFRRLVDAAGRPQAS
ncbi:helix-turn-helix transcriptional regulator [Streptomyces sp. NPDC047981]|uniref:helix-turn-helix domain-containing protein n=1 Tax=Streptomyces sp. NPDC047981 TaxID=3154610 RepID=UPI003417047B